MVRRWRRAAICSPEEERPELRLDRRRRVAVRAWCAGRLHALSFRPGPTSSSRRSDCCSLQRSATRSISSPAREPLRSSGHSRGMWNSTSSTYAASSPRRERVELGVQARRIPGFVRHARRRPATARSPRRCGVADRRFVGIELNSRASRWRAGPSTGRASTWISAGGARAASRPGPRLRPAQQLPLLATSRSICSRMEASSIRRPNAVTNPPDDRSVRECASSSHPPSALVALLGVTEQAGHCSSPGRAPALAPEDRTLQTARLLRVERSARRR